MFLISLISIILPVRVFDITLRDYRYSIHSRFWLRCALRLKLWANSDLGFCVMIASRAGRIPTVPAPSQFPAFALGAILEERD